MVGTAQTQNQQETKTVGTTTGTPTTGTTRSQEESATLAQSTDALMKSLRAAIGSNPAFSREKLIEVSSNTDFKASTPFSTLKVS